MQNIQALVIKQYGTKLSYEKINLRPLNNNEVLIKVQASTINPSDRYFLSGNYFPRPLPTNAGIQGTGRVVDVKGQAVEHLLNKRVVFVALTGSWAEYTIAQYNSVFQISEDVPLSSAASGFINPITVLAMLHLFKQKKFKGIIHTAAASALGRMLNKICKRQNIPLINVVRKQEQADLLKSEGAQHIVVTQGDWVHGFSEMVKAIGTDCVFDAISGGQIIQKLIPALNIGTSYYVYGRLSGTSLVINNPGLFFSGLNIQGFHLMRLFKSASKQQLSQIFENFSENLKNDLSTTTYKQYNFKDIQQAIQVSIKQPTKGKILLRP